MAEIKSGINNVKEMIWFGEKIYVIDGSPAIGVYSNCNPSKRYEQVDRITFMNRSDCPEDMILVKSIRMIVAHWGKSMFAISGVFTPWPNRPWPPLWRKISVFDI